MTFTDAKRYQSPCVAPRKKHQWNLSDVCVYCSSRRVTGKQRMADWRKRNLKQAA